MPKEYGKPSEPLRVAIKRFVLEPWSQEWREYKEKVQQEELAQTNGPVSPPNQGQYMGTLRGLLNDSDYDLRSRLQAQDQRRLDGLYKRRSQLADEQKTLEREISAYEKPGNKE